MHTHIYDFCFNFSKVKNTEKRVFSKYGVVLLHLLHLRYSLYA